MHVMYDDDDDDNECMCDDFRNASITVELEKIYPCPIACKR
jgi:hypothetical protein